MDAEPGVPDQIDAVLPRGVGHQFVFYGDACSGVAGAGNEYAFARTNDIVRRLAPAPQFVVFAGDEVVGLTTSEVELREQWRHCFRGRDGVARPVCDPAVQHDVEPYDL